MNKKNLQPVVILGVIALILLFVAVNSGNGVNNMTPIGAAETFVKAATEGDTKLMKEINKSEMFMYPPSICFDNAKRSGWTGLDYKKDFTYELVKPFKVKVTCIPTQKYSLIELTKLDGRYYFYEYVRR